MIRENINRPQLCGLMTALFILSFAMAPVGARGEEKIPWETIRQIAQDYVKSESPPTVWPFERADISVLSQARPKVFAHYFDPFPLSYANVPAQDDYYAVHYLLRGGEHGKFARMGGYLRGRPLPIGPWPNAYWRQINYAIEIFRAQMIGLDGFVCDMMETNSGRYWDEMVSLTETAAAVAPGFSIIPEPDMSGSPSLDRAELERALLFLARSPAIYRLTDGRMLVAPFDADQQPSTYWENLVADMARQDSPIALLPVLLDFHLQYPRFLPFSFGLSRWGERDPDDFTSDTFASKVRGAKSGQLALMMPVAPQDVRPKTSMFWEADNTRLFREGWRLAMAMNAEYVHILTWNDYSESSEIAPSTGTQFVFYDLAGFYTQWLKTGQMPRVTRDAIFYTHRRQIEHAGEPPNPEDIPMLLRGSEPVHNEIEMLAFLTAPSQLQIENAGHLYSVNAEAGLAELRAPAEVGRPLFRIARQGKVVVEKRSDWAIKAEPTIEDPTYAGGSSTRDFVQPPPPE